MYNKVDAKINLPEIDKKILDFWEKDNTFEKSVKQREGQKPFVFFEGPPGLNGMPHIGHCMSRVFKDLVLRYKTMRGYYVERKAGWDTHGLPVELRAESELQIKNKQELEKFGMEKFVDKCKEVLSEYKGVWQETSKKIGFWVDLDNAYYTFHEDYIESVWWSLKQLFDRGLLFKGYRVAPYCSRCGTSLAEHEVAQGYEEVTDKTLFVKFKVKDEDNTFFVAWTTTPWTLPSNVALCVNKEADYSLVKANGENYIVASLLAPKIFEEFETIKTFKGAHLERKEYEPLYRLPQKYYEGKKGWYVTCGDFVTLDDGSGIVHIAPAFGEDDYNIGKEYDLPFVQLVDEAGKMKTDIVDYAEMPYREANEKIIIDLKNAGKVVKMQKYKHDYPHCWRCHTPLMYYAREGWFIRMSDFRQQLVKNNNKVNWYPANAKDGRMGNFLANERDWNLSRDRYWSTPLPLWVCDKCGKTIAVESKEELVKLSGYKEDFELHRPYVDKVTIPCGCGGVMHRVPQVIDVWYESGAMPFASLHYPFENQDIFEKRRVADFILEGQDQTRGWFHSLQAISTVLFDETPYKNCVMTGLVLDKNGNKMSKSLGNVVDPLDITNRFGADSFRWYFASNSVPWQSIPFSEDGLLEVQRKMIGTLWNVYSFFVLYANIDNFKGGQNKLENLKLSLMDKWILSRLNSLIKSVQEKMDDYNWTQATRQIENFVDELSNWYIRRSRERFWVDGESEDKTAGFETLYHVLTTITKLIAPVMPFLSEEIFLNLTDNQKSVHLCDYPECDDKFVDKSLESRMQDVMNIVDLARTVRASTNLKTRQPLSRMLIHSLAEISLKEEELNIIKDDINVKNIEFIENPEEFLTYELKPQLKTLGPKFGARLGEIKSFLQNCNAGEVVQKVQNGQKIEVAEGITLEEEDILIYSHSRPTYSADSKYGLTIVLDTNLTDELICEGHMREIISKIQNMRKESGFEVEDKIVVTYSCGDELEKVIEKTKDEIAKVVLATEIKKGDADKIVDINGQELCVKLEKVK